MSGYPSRRPISPVGGYYDVREVRPSTYDRARDMANLNRYGTPSNPDGRSVGYPSERTYPDLGRDRRDEDRYMPPGVDITSLDRSLLSRSPPPRYTPPPAYSPARPSGRSAVPHRSSPLRDNHSSSRRTAGLQPDLGTMAGESRPYDIFDRPPPRRNAPIDDLDILDAAARRSSHRSPPPPPAPRRSVAEVIIVSILLGRTVALGVLTLARTVLSNADLDNETSLFEARFESCFIIRLFVLATCDHAKAMSLARNNLLAVMHKYFCIERCLQIQLEAFPKYQDKMPRSLASPTEGIREANDLPVAPSSPSTKSSLRRRLIEKVLKHKKARTDTSVPVPQVDGIKAEERGKTTDHSQEWERSLSYEDYLIHTRPRDVWLPLDPSVSPIGSRV
ncbi:hypothetical protein CERZMDRAFT_96963 [Cercospora zeae-maydis SCOH1-5]|uniref:Uncharacterized protein n=1 Tax=Cercospora zeae-maydis SCOH1-5 TaxID=717836 RepID=A0A6A6FJ57_9PEZI|nr:hypothetical protein CERZMDRAFT_96963 [Cercospora zeae-maydis SCOH1-5]